MLSDAPGPHNTIAWSPADGMVECGISKEQRRDKREDLVDCPLNYEKRPKHGLDTVCASVYLVFIILKLEIGSVSQFVKSFYEV